MGILEIFKQAAEYERDPELDTAILAYLEFRDTLGCGSSSCGYRKERKGQMTNGPCKCIEEMKAGTKIKLRRMINIMDRISNGGSL